MESHALVSAGQNTVLYDTLLVPIPTVLTEIVDLKLTSQVKCDIDPPPSAQTENL